MDRRNTDTIEIVLEDTDESIAPDRELLVWEKWIQIRKEETTKLGRKLNRPPVDLAMNVGEQVREDKERKVALEHAQVEKKLTTIKGAYFEPPARLDQQSVSEPVYEVQRTRVELGRPKVIEHIGIPTYIQKTELGMSGEPKRKLCPQLDADYKKYRTKRENDLKEKLKKIDPFKPSTSQLMIKGCKPMTPPPKIPPGPLITFEEPPNDPMKSVRGVYAVRINKSIFYKKIPGQNLVRIGTFCNPNTREDCISWLYYFNVPTGRIGRGKLSIQNLGTVTLKYYWKNIRRSLPFISENLYEQVFFFNKNEDVLSPGQSTDICLSFMSNKANIYSEFWELCFFNVCFFDTTNKKLTIELYADSVDNLESMKRGAGVIKAQIEGRSLYHFGKEIINEIVDKAVIAVPQIYPYKKYFLERELFVMRNPVCFYHQTEVAKLKELFNKEVTKGLEWDLSIATWRKHMIEKPFDDRMKYYDLLKKGHGECLKPWYEGEGLLKDKYRAMSTLWSQLADKLDKDYARVCSFYDVIESSFTESTIEAPTINIDPLIKQKISNMFYLYAYEHVANTIELCAGILSSLDSNKWIEFDFCRS